MFNLAYPLIQTAVINGTTYELDMSFDNILRLIDMLNDDELTDWTQVETGLQMLIGTTLQDIEATQKVHIFQSLFMQAVQIEETVEQPVDIAGNPMPVAKKKSKELYSLIEDAEYIYASFMMDYRMDLFEWQGKLHWRKFQALLVGLSDETIFKKVLDIRDRPLPTGPGTEKERKNLIEAKRTYALKGQTISEDDYDGDEEE